MDQLAMSGNKPETLAAAFRRRRTVLRHRLGTIFQLSIYGLCRRNAFSHVLSYYR